jgi:maltose/moltooligosaccharide transporter
MQERRRGAAVESASSATRGPSGAAPTDDKDRLRLGRAFVYSSGNFGAGMFYAFNNFILSLLLKDLGAGAVLIGLLSSTRSVEGSVIQPLVGAWSDRTWWGQLGRRRPFIVMFIPISAALLVATAFAPSIPGFAALAAQLGLSLPTFRLIVVAVGIFLFSLTFNIMIDPYTALLADITPVRHRGNVNGLFQFIGAAGQMTLLFASIYLFGVMVKDRAYFILFLVTASALVLFFVPSVLGVHEPARLTDAPVRVHHSFGDYLRALRGERQIQLYFATQFFLWFGINGITPFLTPFAESIGFSPGGASLLALVLLLVTAVFNWPLGALADRLGLKRVFIFGMILMAGASIAGSIVRDHTLLFVILAFAGVGNAAQTGSSYPLLTRLVRPDRMGLYTGLQSTIASIAAPASAFLTGLIIDQIGYRVMFPVVAVMFLAALVPLSLLDLRAGEARMHAELNADVDASTSGGE